MTGEYCTYDVGLLFTQIVVIYCTLSTQSHCRDSYSAFIRYGTANFATCGSFKTIYINLSCTQHNAICRKFTKTSAGLHLGVSTDLSSLVSISSNTAIIDYLPSLSRAECVMHRSSAANTIIRIGDRPC